MSDHLRGKTVLLGITGSIAAYKGAELARRLMDLGAEVHVTLTKAGAQFITPLTLRGLTRNPVTVDMFEEPGEWSVKHVSLAQRASVVVIAPASADALGKLALGLADEFIFAAVLASRAPLVVAPAMNDVMFAHPAVQKNLEQLRSRGVYIVEPETGHLASGAQGQGRLAQPEVIVNAIVEILTSGDLQGLKMLVTAGPTREPLDPVRFISNRSSGKMGYALAEVAVRRGAQVTLVSGPTSLAAPDRCEVVQVETAKEMTEEVFARFGECDVMIAAAAVADYTPSEVRSSKMKKSEQALSLKLEPTPDILVECGKRKTSQFLVGFAAETEEVLEHARQKLAAKKLDLMVANDVSRKEIGFESDSNAGYIISADGAEMELPVMTKIEFAGKILDEIAKRSAKF